MSANERTASPRPLPADDLPETDRETLAERLTYHGYAAGDRLARALSERGARVLARVLAATGHAMLRTVRERVSRNQAQVLGLPQDDPLVRASTREAFRLYLRYWVDTFRLRDLSREQVLDRMDATGLEHITETLREGRGAIAVLPHMGNWDAAGAWIAAEGVRVVSVAEELRPRRLFELFKRHREQVGLQIVGLNRNGGVGRKLAGALDQGSLVALVADRDLSGRGVPVEMFGRERTVPAGPALLSLTTEAPVLVCVVSTTPTGWRINIEPPIRCESTGDRRADVTALTRRLAERFEEAIASNPADWHVFQPGWPEPRATSEEPAAAP
ncbi:MAG: phosphatidylinositol mannoside acyltransferase [Actinomycetota bacterium]